MGFPEREARTLLVVLIGCCPLKTGLLHEAWWPCRFMGEGISSQPAHWVWSSPSLPLRAGVGQCLFVQNEGSLVSMQSPGAALRSPRQSMVPPFPLHGPVTPAAAEHPFLNFCPMLPAWRITLQLHLLASWPMYEGGGERLLGSVQGGLWWCIPRRSGRGRKWCGERVLDRKGVRG